MPIVIILIGIVLVFAALNNKLSTLSQLLQDDWNPKDGSISFGLWALALVIIGIIGYVKELKPFSNAFLVLVFIAILLSNKGFFNQFMAAFENKNIGGLGKGPTSSGPSLSAGNTLQQVISSFTPSLEGLPSLPNIGGSSDLNLPMDTNLNILNLGGQ